jgi:hypothetical protein
MRAQAGPILIAIAWNAGLRRLSLTFDRTVTTNAGLTATDLQYFDGANRYDWVSTVTPNGTTVVYQQSPPAAQIVTPRVRYAANPPAIVDSKGVPWPAGDYF